MNRTLEISIYVAGGVSAVVLAHEIYKRKNSGIGLFTTKESMGKYVATSSKGVRDVYSKDNIYDFLKSWMTFGNDYTKAWYQAVWKSENGKETPYFFVNGKRHVTKGGFAG